MKKYFKWYDKDDTIGYIAIGLFVLFVGFIIYCAITSPAPQKSKSIKIEKKTVLRAEVTGRYQKRKIIMFEDGSKEYFSIRKDGFFLEQGDTVVYVNNDIECIIFKNY